MIWLLSCAPVPDAELYVTALDPEIPIAEALSACAAMSERSDECATAVVAQRDGDPAICQSLASEWGEECHFRVAERLMAQGERWEALVECGLSRRYYDECLYHLWSRELQTAVEPDSAEISRAVDHEAAGGEVVDYFSGLRTIRQDPEELLWADFWYFAHTRNRPARLEDCTDSVDPDRCVRGTQVYVERLVTESLTRATTDPAVRDRACRSGELPDAIGEGAWIADGLLEAPAIAGLANACQTPIRRPWSPSFMPMRPL
ncbi:MAG TPA: hypothetical protein QGF58_17240 [Myxococcota bacterium]|nr:hypothetical protein [Myxococcota bacterium]